MVKASDPVGPAARALDLADLAGRASDPADLAGKASDPALRAWEERGEGEVADVLAAKGDSVPDSARVSGRAMIPSQVP